MCRKKRSPRRQRRPGGGLRTRDGDILDGAFDEVFQANVKSQLVSVKAALPELRRSRGSVVLTVSTSGFYPGRGGILYFAPSATKARAVAMPTLPSPPVIMATLPLRRPNADLLPAEPASA